MTASEARKELHQYASQTKARVLRSFFKTGPGQYGEGDVFIGVNVPETRRTARAFSCLSSTETLKLLKSRVHEERLLALLILIAQYEKGDARAQSTVVSLYLKNTPRINNWDLVDVSAPKILGDFLKNRPRGVLRNLAHSPSLWERRIAIVSTFAFIRLDEFNDTFRIADMLIADKEDLIHKATGWMLREAGKRNAPLLEKFLEARCTAMPRTMLRYALEQFSREDRKKYMTKKG